MPIERGTSIGPYRLLAPIGEGGMGVVWRARDTALDRDVAIKFLPEAVALHPDRLARFEREAKAVAALSHPVVLAIYGFGEHQGSAYAVTELLEGETLREALSPGPLDPGRALGIARQVARGLAAAHDRGIVHRDVKPENVFLTGDGHVKVLDFGLAAYVDASPAHGAQPEAAVTPTRTSLTTPGTILGTTDYLSPEQVRGAPADARSDVFSFGAMLHEMLTGRRPFQRETAAETMTAILREDPPPVRGTFPALAAIAARCLAKAPQARYSSARELSAALEAVHHAEPHGRNSRRLPLLAAAVAVVALVASGLAWMGRNRSAVPPPAPSLSSIGEAPSANSEANEYFQKGLLFIRSQLDIPKAQAMLDKAIALDPSFGSARGIRGLINLIAIHEGFSNDGELVYASERTAREVIAADPELASGHATLGAALLYMNRKDQAREEFAASLRLGPQSQPGIAWLTIDDRWSDRLQGSEARARRILEVTPLFWAARIMLAEALFDQGRIEEAERETEKVFEQDPENLSALRQMARIHLYRGDARGAREMLERISAATHPNFRVRLLWALLLAREGRREEAIAALDPATLRYAEIALFAQAQAAEIFALAGLPDLAFNWLDRAVRAGDERSSWFRRNVFLASLQRQPRFQMVLDAIDQGRR
ncbi:MAG TPA: protein kinase [Candidatus Polarisedimenticolaceae bacterium]|nr:protein kinase [Candidatus Polarisedimenticolaceae bacterium]